MTMYNRGTIVNKLYKFWYSVISLTRTQLNRNSRNLFHFNPSALRTIVFLSRGQSKEHYTLGNEED